jgi:hypothetical protein
MHFTQANTTGFTDNEIYRMNAVMTAQLENEGLPPTLEGCIETGDETEYRAIFDCVVAEMDRRVASGLER